MPDCHVYLCPSFPSLTTYMFANMGEHMDTKMVISRATSHFPKSDFDTMLLGMSQRAPYTQTESNIFELVTFADRSRLSFTMILGKASFTKCATSWPDLPRPSKTPCPMASWETYFKTLALQWNMILLIAPGPATVDSGIVPKMWKCFASSHWCSHIVQLCPKSVQWCSSSVL